MKQERGNQANTKPFLMIINTQLAPRRKPSTQTQIMPAREREREITESEVGSEKEYKRKRMSRGERARERKESQRKPIQPTDKQGYRREER